MAVRKRLGATVRSTFASLRTRNFRLFFIGQTISNTGNWLTTVALTLLVLHLTHSGLAIGLITAAQYGPLLLFAVTVGFGWCFSIDAASYLVVLMALWMMRPTELRRIGARPRARGEIRVGLRYVADNPNIWISFVMLGAVGMLAYNFIVTLSLLVT